MYVYMYLLSCMIKYNESLVHVFVLLLYLYSKRYKIWHVTKGIVYACEVPRPRELWEVSISIFMYFSAMVISLL